MGRTAALAVTIDDARLDTRASVPLEVDAGAQNPYSSLDVGDGDDDVNNGVDGANTPALWRYRWLGRILVWRVAGGSIYIGPHWYCSLIMLAFIIGVGAFSISSAAAQDAFSWNLLGNIAATILSTFTFLRCALADPGVLKAKAPKTTTTLAEAEAGNMISQLTPGRALLTSDGRRSCKFCNVLQPKGCSHCHFCQVCIEGFDHHCPWMGKCIGRSNIVKFYTFIAVSMLSLGYIFFMTMFSSTMPPRPSTIAAAATTSAVTTSLTPLAATTLAAPVVGSIVE